MIGYCFTLTESASNQLEFRVILKTDFPRVLLCCALCNTAIIDQLLTIELANYQIKIRSNLFPTKDQNKIEMGSK